MSELPPLHPDRIREALRVLCTARSIKPDPELFERINQSAIAALELVRKGQLAVGLSANIADGGRVLMAFMEAARKPECEWCGNTHRNPGDQRFCPDTGEP